MSFETDRPAAESAWRAPRREEFLGRFSESRSLSYSQRELGLFPDRGIFCLEQFFDVGLGEIIINLKLDFLGNEFLGSHLNDAALFINTHRDGSDNPFGQNWLNESSNISLWVW